MGLSIIKFRYPLNRPQRPAGNTCLQKTSTVLAFSQFSQPPNSKTVIPLEDGANLVTSKPPASISLQIVAAQSQLELFPCKQKTAKNAVTVVKKYLGPPAGTPRRPRAIFTVNLQQ